MYKEKILQFHFCVINLRKNTNFELSQIANMDEVPLTFVRSFQKNSGSKRGEDSLHKNQWPWEDPLHSCLGMLCQWNQTASNAHL